MYETHSRFSCENEDMASSIVNELNNYATEVHVEELRRSQGENQERQERERSQSQIEPNDIPTEPTTVRIEEELVLPTTPSVHAVVVCDLTSIIQSCSKIWTPFDWLVFN